MQNHFFVVVQFTCAPQIRGFPGDTVVKNLPAYAGDEDSIPEWERSPSEGNGSPLQYSYMKNPMDRGAWQATVHGVTKNRTQRTNEQQHCPHLNKISFL